MSKAQLNKVIPTGAVALIQLLEKHGVTHIFGIPGAKIDSLFIALLNSTIKLVICRHEQNAAFMAAAMGRLASVSELFQMPSQNCISLSQLIG
jgi:glyoxylate carboligase